MLGSAVLNRCAQNRDLQDKATLHDQLKGVLDNLYTAVFAGPTPGMFDLLWCLYLLFTFAACVSDFPEEDNAEQRFKAAEKDYQIVRDSPSFAINLRLTLSRHNRVSTENRTPWPPSATLS
jgi:hypothetical protein